MLAGVARSDTPGHCAKYGSFTVIEAGVNKSTEHSSCAGIVVNDVTSLYSYNKIIHEITALHCLNVFYSVF